MTERKNQKPQIINSQSVLPPDTLKELSKWERLFWLFPELIKQFAALLIIVAGFGLLICVIVSNNPALQEFRSAAWTLVASIIGAALTYLFGAIKRNSDE